MTGETPASSFWAAVRTWADDAGLLLPQDEDQAAQPKVPPAVCESCPICQGAATLDQVNPDLFTDLADLARNVVSGLASAMASASDQRDRGDAPSQDVVGEPAPLDQADARDYDPANAERGDGEASPGEPEQVEPPIDEQEPPER